MIERNGGKVNVTITTKTAFIICSTLTKDVIENAKAHNLTLISEHYILDCISARKRLPLASYILQETDKKNKKDHNKEDSDNIYTFSGTPLADKENHMYKIREKLKQFSLKNNKRNKEDNVEDKDRVAAPSKKIKLVAKRNEIEDEAIPPLKDLVFFIYGKFSIPVNVLGNIILERGGGIASAVDDTVTHFLFGGESVDVPEFQEAQRRKIHIVNEYFLRLLVKY